MLEQQFLTFLVDRLDAKLSELKGVELQAVKTVAQEMEVFTTQMRSVVDQVFTTEETATPQRTVTRRKRNAEPEQQKTGGEQ
jgi:hypothetical protein